MAMMKIQVLQECLPPHKIYSNEFVTEINWQSQATPNKDWSRSEIHLNPSLFYLRHVRQESGNFDRIGR